MNIYKSKKPLVFLGLIVAISVAEFVFAEAAPAAAPQGSPITKLFPLFAIITAIYYFMILAPQKAELKKRNALLESLQAGDNVVTTSGIIGKVASLEKDYVILEIAANTKVKFEKNHIDRKI